MSNENLKERIKAIAYLYRTSVRGMERKAGLNTGVLSGMGENLGSDKIDKILTAFPDINPVWLLSGKGSMTTSNTQQIPVRKEEHSKLEEPVISDRKYIAGLEEQNRQLKQQLEAKDKQIASLLALLAATTNAKTSENE